jgi:hypothetical protein
MEERRNVTTMTLRDMLLDHLGVEQTDELLNAVQLSIEKNVRGDALKEIIYTKLCEMNIRDIEVITLMDFIPKMVIPKPVITGDNTNKH